jgi:hypothetical protein
MTGSQKDRVLRGALLLQNHSSLVSCQCGYEHANDPYLLLNRVQCCNITKCGPISFI